MGVDADCVDAFVASSEDDAEDADDVHVWPENAAAFGVFCRCDWQRQDVNDGHTVRSVPTGIAASEIREVADLMGVPRERWAGLLDDVRLLAATVLPILQRNM